MARSSHRTTLDVDMTDMTVSEAIQILVDVASRWGENGEEAFSRRILPTDTDADCRQIAIASAGEGESADNYYDDIIEIRNLWIAIEVAQREINKPVNGAPR